MAKTNPIGVRFRPEVLEKLKTEHGIDSPQAALVFLERFYCQHWELTKSVTAPLRDSPMSQSKAKQQSESGKGINTITDEKPRNLEELKALCPPELTDEWDRRAWIRTERQKYGI